MFGNRHRDAENEELRARIASLTNERDGARDGEQAAVKGAAVVARHRDEAQAAARRTADRNRQLTEQLELAREAQGDDDYAALEARLERALKACARYRAELAAAGVRDGLSMAMYLELSERARRDLDTKLREVQKVNDYMCRERVTAAGNLTVSKPTAPGREPGVAS